MKKFLLSAIAATVAVSPVATTVAEAAPARHTTVVQHRDNGRTVVIDRQVRGPAYNRGNAGHRWAKGQRFDRRYAQNYRQIDYSQYRGRHLYAPPRGYQWVQSGNDAVLIAVTGGLIGRGPERRAALIGKALATGGERSPPVSHPLSYLASLV